ncbi:MAG: hypothetical protein WC657_07925 [Candidatus Paceibacterota bacterium]|jgi:hypothetical protein
MTKRKALEICEAQWLWTAENGKRRKWDYEGAKDLVLECACCEYVSQHGPDPSCRYIEDGDCAKCPIPASAWGAEKCGVDFVCELDGSVYLKWLMSKTNKDRCKFASQIAALARSELNKMDKK